VCSGGSVAGVGSHTTVYQRLLEKAAIVGAPGIPRLCFYQWASVDHSPSCPGPWEMWEGQDHRRLQVFPEGCRGCISSWSGMSPKLGCWLQRSGANIRPHLAGRIKEPFAFMSASWMSELSNLELNFKFNCKISCLKT
jgi:hypothetical protein